MSQKMIRWATGAALVVLIAGVSLVLAEPPDRDKNKGPSYKLAGTWYANNSAGDVFVYSIVETAPDEYVLGGGGSIRTTEDPLGLGITRQTGWLGRAERTGKNTYAVTYVNYFATPDTAPPSRGLVGAGMCSGTLVQTGPDELVVEMYCAYSCNPCWAGCWSGGTCDPARLWDPFVDETAICGQGGAVFHWARRTGLVDFCIPGAE